MSPNLTIGSKYCRFPPPALFKTSVCRAITSLAWYGRVRFGGYGEVRQGWVGSGKVWVPMAHLQIKRNVAGLGTVMFGSVRCGLVGLVRLG
ncbi:MAG: hypothetical protein WC919_05645 [Candidatus Paceibacterota bacterium]